MVSQGGGSRLHAALLELSILLSPTAVHPKRTWVTLMAIAPTGDGS